jgi:hypothetical protein
MPEIWQFFSNIAFALNIVYINKGWNTVLYLCNVVSFIGAAFLVATNPGHFYATVHRFFPFLKGTPPAMLHFLNVVWHGLPLYLFRKRQTLEDIFSLPTIAGFALFMLTYSFFMSDTDLYTLYGKDRHDLFKLFAGALLLLSAVHYILYNFGK